MQAIRSSFVAERTLRFEPFDFPDHAGEHELLLEMERTIISAGTELANYTGLEPLTRVPGSWCYYPWTPGYGGIGRVIDVGPKVQGYQVGDHVYGVFSHSTHNRVNVRSQIATKIPDGTDLTKAIFTRMACVAITGYHRAEKTLGDTVVIIGLGLVGNLCGQFYAMNGMTVIGLDPAEKRRELAESCGFAATFDPGTPGLQDRINELSHGRGARVVVDAVGQSALVVQAIELCARLGQVILLGSPRADYTANMTPSMSKVHLAGIDVKGALEWIYPLLKDPYKPITIEGNSERILEWIFEGRLKVDPLLSHLIAPNELGDAYEGLLERKNDYLGVVVDWTKGVQL